MPSRPAINQSDGRLKHNREAKQGERKTPPKTKVVKARINQRMQDLLDGKIKIEDLSDEELAKGRCVGPNGKFGKQSALIPSKFYQQAMAEYKRRMEAKFAKDVEPMREVLRQLATNPKAHADARYKSATYLIDRGIGKVSDKVETTVEVKPWEGLVGEVFLDYEEGEKPSEDKE